MKQTLDIDIELSGFPVGFTNPITGERVEIWFDSSLENLKRIIVEENYEEFEIYEQKLKEDSIHETNVETVIEHAKGTLEYQYDFSLVKEHLKNYMNVYQILMHLNVLMNQLSKLLLKKSNNKQKKTKG
ncbi:hypothetical protein SNF32_09765 [Enterococcus mundtii]|nr:hypothetical protein [Enterococcus mundtii]